MRRGGDSAGTCGLIEVTDEGGASLPRKTHAAEAVIGKAFDPREAQHMV